MYPLAVFSYPGDGQLYNTTGAHFVRPGPHVMSHNNFHSQSGPTNHTMSYTFNPANNLTHGPNDLVSSISKLAINTNPQMGQSDLNTTANEFVPKSAPISRAMPPNVPPFDFNAGNSGKYSFGRGQPMHPASSPQMPMRGMGRVQNSPPLHLSPGQLQHSVDPGLHSGIHHSQLRRAEMAHQPLHHSAAHPDAAHLQDNYHGGTTYYYNQDEYIQPTLRQTFPNVTMYAGMPTYLAHMKQTSEASGLFIGDAIKSNLLERQGAMLSGVEGYADLPDEVDNFCHLVPLEPSKVEMREHYNYPCTAYKAVNKKNGLVYCLQRIHGFKLTSQAMDNIGKWKELSCPGIVQLRQVFTTKTFGDNSLVFVYDFHPCAEVMLSKLLNHQVRSLTSNGYSSPFNIDGSARPYSAGKGSRKILTGQISESTLWSHTIQLINALRTIHHHNLSANGLPSKSILISYKDKLRINCLGILDVIAYDPNFINSAVTVSHLQKKDLRSLGLILLALGCNSLLAFRPEHFSQSLDIISNSNYSTNFVKLVKCLISAFDPSTGNTSTMQVDDLLPLISTNLLLELNSHMNRYDFVENELSKSVENGRLFKVQAKLNTILERPELNMDSQWSETGDRYILKLFRGYVYHQTAENGSPWLDMAHVITTLNKLDAGVPEKICLSSSDESAVIVVSYAELKRCFESAFSDILQSNVASYSQ